MASLTMLISVSVPSHFIHLVEQSEDLLVLLRVDTYSVVLDEKLHEENERVRLFSILQSWG
jgi:hypothetical protein